MKKREVGHYKIKKMKGNNPLDPYGIVSKCKICESINHLENDCPDKDYGKMLHESDSYMDDLTTYYVETLKEVNNSEKGCQNDKPVSPTKKEKRLNGEENLQYAINFGKKKGLDKYTIDQVKNGPVFEHIRDINSELVNNLSNGVESMANMNFNTFDTIRYDNKMPCYNTLQNSAYIPACSNRYSRSFSRRTCYTCHRQGHVSRYCPITLNKNNRMCLKCYRHEPIHFYHKGFPRIKNFYNCEKETECYYQGTQSLIPRGRVVKDKYSVNRHQDC